MLRDSIRKIIKIINYPFLSKEEKNPIWDEYKRRVIDKADFCDYKKGCGYYLSDIGTWLSNSL